MTLPWGQLATMVVLAVVVLAALVRVALRSVHGIRLDQRLMDSLGASEQAWVRIIDVLTTITVGSTAIGLAVCLVVGLSRRRWAAGIGAVILVAGANITTQVLKYHVLHRVDGGRNTLPSGHTTVSLSLIIAAVLVAPVAWRRILVPLGGFVGTFVAAGTIAGHWHRPGDVLAGQAVCLLWAALAITFVVLTQSRAPARVARDAYHLWLALLGSSLVGLVFVAWGIRPSGGDVDLPMAMAALVPVGVITAVIIGWIARLADRHLA